MPVIGVAIVAAGRGARAGGVVPKQFRLLGGKPLLRWSVERFARRADVARIVIAAPFERRQDARAACAGLLPEPEIVVGGDTRTQSVRACLHALSAGEPLDLVLIHDAARPFVSDVVIERVISALEDADAAAPTIRPADALKRIETDGLLGQDIDRDAAAAVQTPQGARFPALLEAFAALEPEADLPDDIAVAARAGLRTVAVEGDPDMFKITTPSDFTRAEALLVRSQPRPRVATGFGFDAHRLAAGDGMTLCGVLIPGALSLVGHSDADVALHAVTDAVLGALGEGDIGDHFPPSDPQWAGAASRRFLDHAVGLAAASGATIAHADLTLVCERPRIKPHRSAMRARLAEILGVPESRASVKATTTEGMGFTGRGEGVAAQAVVTLTWPEAEAPAD